MADLTEKQKRFSDYYIETGNYYESAIRAGYSENYSKAQSYKLLDNVGIKDYIDTILNKKDNERIASQNEVLEYYTNLMRGLETDEIVTLDPGKGFTRTEQRVDAKVRLSAAKELAKRYGIDKQIDVQNDEGVEISWEE